MKIMCPPGYHHNGFVATNRTSCAQVHELPQSHYDDNREGTSFSRLHIYYAHLVLVRIEHSVYCESLMTTLMYIYIKTSKQMKLDVGTQSFMEKKFTIFSLTIFNVLTFYIICPMHLCILYKCILINIQRRFTPSIYIIYISYINRNCVCVCVHVYIREIRNYKIIFSINARNNYLKLGICYFWSVIY